MDSARVVGAATFTELVDRVGDHVREEIRWDPGEGLETSGAGVCNRSAFALGFREEVRMDWRERIVGDPQTLHGKLLVRGTRIPVSVVLDNLAMHVDLREVLASYPSLSEDDVRACIAWAAELSQGRAGVIDADFEDLTEPATGTEQPASAAGGAPTKATSFKEFLRSMPNVGDDGDFERPLDYGRSEIEWDT